MGATPDALAVGPDGAAVYTLPLEVPAGRLGMEPALALTYSSNASNGLFGVGFMLAGAPSSITRCPPRDGTGTAVDFDGESFCWNGERLVALDGLTPRPAGDTLCTASSCVEYRTRNESFARIYGIGSRKDPTSFRIETRDGRVLLFETRVRAQQFESNDDFGVDSPTLAREVTLEWALSRELDRRSNSIVYTYTGDSGSTGKPWFTHRLDEIHYTGFGATAGNRRVRFVYEARPDVRDGFTSGVQVRLDRRVSAIEMYGPDAAGTVGLQWRYALQYKNDSITGRSLLQKVQRFDAAGASQPSTQFEWTRGDFEVEGVDLETPAGVANLAVDLDGDGRSDLLTQPRELDTDPPLPPCPTAQEWQARINTGSPAWSMFAGGVCTGFHESPIAVDFDADGAANVIAVSYRTGTVEIEVPPSHADGSPSTFRYDSATEASWRTYRWSGGSPGQMYTLQNLGGSVNPSTTDRADSVYVGDFDGNGTRDIVRRDFLDSWFYQGGRDDYPLFDDRFARTFGYEGAPDSPEWTYRGFFQITDVEGDGTSDFLILSSDIDTVSAQPQYAAACLGDDTCSSRLVPLRASLDYRFMDVNGDGLEDVVDMRSYILGSRPADGGLRIRFNIGNGYAPWQSGVEAGFTYVPFDDFPEDQDRATVDRRTYVLDYNLDGREDFIVLGDTPRVYLSNGTTFRPQSLPFAHDDAPVTTAGVYTPLTRRPPFMLADTDGDGVTDFLVGETLREQRRTTAVPDRIVAVHRAFGARDRIEYSPVRERLLDRGVSCRYPLGCGDLRMEVVSAIHRDRALGSSSDPIEASELYSYAAPRVDAQRGAFLAFGRVRREIPDAQRVEETLYGSVGEFEWIGTSTGRTAHFGLSRLPTETWALVTTPGQSIVEHTALTHAEAPGSHPGTFELQISAIESETYHTVSSSCWDGVDPALPIEERINWAVGHGCPELWDADRRLSSVYSDWDHFGNPHVVTTTSLANRVETIRYEYRGLPYGAPGTGEEAQAQPGFSTALPLLDRIEHWLITQPDVVSVTSRVNNGGTVEDETRATALYWDSDGQLMGMVREPLVPLGDPESLQLATHVHRDGYGNVTRLQEVDHVDATDGLSDERNTSFGYDDDATHLRWSRNAAGHLSWIGIHPSLAVPLIQVDANGVRTRWRYDRFGRLREQIGQDGSGALITHVYGNASVTVAARGGGSREMMLDRLHRTVRTASTGLGGIPVESNREFDVLGRVTLERQGRVGGAPGRVVRPEEDLLGRLTALRIEPREGETPQLVQTTRYDDFGIQQVRTIDAEGESRTLHADADGAPQLARDVDDAGVTLATSYRLGPFGQLESSTDVGTNETIYARDALGRPIYVEDPDRGGRALHYNAWNELISSEDDAHGLITYQRDALGRVTERRHAGGVTTYVWDLEDHGLGALSTAIGEDGHSIRVLYDALGRPRDVSYSIEGVEYLTTYGYDAYGRIASIYYPTANGDRLAVSYEYDPSSGLLYRIETKNGEVVWQLLEHDGQGRPTAMQAGQNRVELEYDAIFGVQRRLRVRRGPASSDDPLISLTTTLYADGMLQDRLDEVSGRLEAYEYDALDRIRRYSIANKSDDSRYSTYEYTSDGNLDRVTTEIAVADEPQPIVEEKYRYERDTGGGPHAVSVIDTTIDGSTSSARFEYDKSGRQVAAPGRLVLYSVADLPRRIDENGRVTYFEYDPFDRRAVTRGDGFIAHHVGGLFEHRDNSFDADENTSYVFGPTGLIAIVTERDGGPREAFYQHADHLGTAALVTDATGAVVSSQTFDPFGRRLDEHLRDAPRAPAPEGTGRRGFTGHRDEGELDLVDMQGRFYDPIARRFLTPDPLVSDVTSSQSWNPYSWVANVGPNATDPTGWIPCPPGDTCSDGDWQTLEVFGPLSPADRALERGNAILERAIAGARGGARGPRGATEWHPTENDLRLAREAVNTAPTGMAEFGVPTRGGTETAHRVDVHDGFAPFLPINFYTDYIEEGRRLHDQAILERYRRTAAGQLEAILRDWRESARNAPPWVWGIGGTIAGFVPGAGETMDIIVVLDPNSTTGERALGIISLGANVLTAGLLPNFGLTARAARMASGLRHMLRGFQGRRWVFGSANFILDSRGMRHILERHHPTYWAGGDFTEIQTFLNPRLTIDDVADIIEQVVLQNRHILEGAGMAGRTQVRGTVDGVEYVVGVQRGRIGQLYPVP